MYKIVNQGIVLVNNEDVVTYMTPYRVVGVIFFVFSFMMWPAIIDAPGAIAFMTLILWCGSTCVCAFLALQIRRKRWDPARQAVVTEKRWMWGDWRERTEPIHNFAEVELLSTTLSQSRNSKPSDSGIMVRVRHKLDSKHAYPGTRSWVIETFRGTSRESEAIALADKMAKMFGLPVDNCLAYS